MPDCKKYGGITRDELNSLRKDLAKEGIEIPSGDDVTVQGPYGSHLRRKQGDFENLYYKETVLHS